MKTAASLALLLVLTTGFYWKVAISGEWSYLEAPDLANQVRPWLDFQARELHAGHLPLWDPFEWGGHSLIGQVQPGITNPLNWILFAMPLRDGHIPISTLHWYWVLIHWLGAAFCYALCRDLSCRHSASILGGAVFALTGFMGHTDWPHVLLGAIWIPIVLLFFLRLIRGQRPLSSAALGGAALGVMFLGCHPVVPVFTSVLIGALWLWSIVRDRSRLKYAAIFFAIAGGIAAAQILPSIEYGKQALRWAGAPEPLHWNELVPFSVHAQYSLGWKSVLGIVMPGISVHANPHVGLVAVALMIVALCLRGARLQRAASTFVSMSGGSLRNPEERRDESRRGTLQACVTWWLLAFALGGLCLALGKDFPPYWLIWRFVPMVEKAREPAFAIVLFQAGIATLAALGASTLRRGLPWIALALFLGEAVYDAPHLARFDRRDSYASIIDSQRDIAAFLKAQPGWFRVDFDEDVVPYNFGDLYGIEQFGGLVSSMPERTQRLLGHEETPRLFGIQYRVARAPSHPAQVEVFRSRSGLRVFRDPRVGEPMWTLRTEPCAGADRFAAVARTPMYVAIDADLACPGLAVVGDAFYPGWRARVDARRTPVQEVSAVRAVRADAGRHRIEFFYRPASIYWGVSLAIVALAAIVALIVRDPPSASANSHVDSIAVS